MKAEMDCLIAAEESGEPEVVTEEILSVGTTAKVGALLFASPKPLSIADLCRATRKKEDQVLTSLDELKGMFDQNIHGFALCEVAGCYELRTNPELRTVVQELIPARGRKLSRAAAETLAVIAYRQPVQRAEIEAIRGVDALPTLKTLLDLRLIRIVGREDSVGQPALYGTTAQFLEKFGLRDLSDLPTERDLKEFAEEDGEIDSQGEPEEDEPLLFEESELQ